MAKRRYHRPRGRYKMTPARKAALRKAQLISARKRRGKSIIPQSVRSHVSRNKGKYIAAGTGAAVLAGAIARHKISGSKFVVGTKTPTTISPVSKIPIGKAGFRHHNFGGGSHALVYVHRTGGTDRHFSYTHNSLREGIFGRKSTKKKYPIGHFEEAVNGGLRIPALAIDTRVGILAGASGGSPSRQIGYNHYERKMNRNGGFSITRRMNRINARYGL